MERDWGGGIYCLLEVPQGCSCQVNILQYTLEGVETVVVKYIRWKSVPLGYYSGENCIYNSCGRWIFVCICLAVTRYEVLVGIYV